ncbi:pheromone receptor [Moniliophthora roreri]|nr:pheromone receptor [Moniliophthora roreri]
MIRSNDPTYPLFPIFSCLGFILSLIPLPWHIQAWNSGTCAFMLWTASFCLVKFVNSLIWAGNVNNVAPVWCDISTQIVLGATIGIPASSLCISRRLYKIAAIRTVSVTRADKRRAVFEDIAIALGIPVLVLIMHIVVHPHRFDIFEDIGCMPTTFNTLAAYFLFLMWPVVLGTISLAYSVVNLRTFYIRRAQFSNLVASSAAMNTSRYLRLMALSCADIMLTVPLGIYVIYSGSHGVPLEPWVSWEETHFGFGRVDLVPALFWRSNKRLEFSVELNRWIAVLCAFVFFALFGFASEAKKNYSCAFWWIAKKFGFRPTTANAPKSTLPQYKPPSVKPVDLSILQSTQAPTTTTLSTNDIELKKSVKAGYPSSPTTPTAPPSYHCSSAHSSFIFSGTEATRYSFSSTSGRHSLTSDFDPSSPTSQFSLPETPSTANATHINSEVSSRTIVTPYHMPLSPPSTYPTAQSRGQDDRMSFVRNSRHDPFDAV